MALREYDLLGPSAKRAVDIGLASAEWYHSDVSRAEMKDLMRRSDGPALRDTLIYYGAMIVLAGIGIALWPSWWSAPFWLVYGVLYASGADSRWHEGGHGTAFKTPWMNNVIYHVACFSLLRNPVLWRWSHARHHTDTIIVGLDPEIITMRPPHIFKVVLLFFGWDSVQSVPKMFRYAFGSLTPQEKTFVPESEWSKAALIARIWLVIYAATLIAALAMGSVLPLMVIGGPVFYGSWHYIVTGLLQHTGMADNVIDHRLNTRTVYLNPFSRFVYWNMNYHIEHHMFPMVPYHALPRLHTLIKDDLPPPNTSIADGLSEVFVALRRQLTDPEYRIKRQLPPTAKPYRLDFHTEALGLAPGTQW